MYFVLQSQGVYLCTLRVSHLGIQRTYTLLEKACSGPAMHDQVYEYVKTCIVCQQDKTVREKSLRILEPLLIPGRPWGSVSVDFISGLPKIRQYWSILVVVDWFSKYAIFMPTPIFYSVEDAGYLFLKNVGKVLRSTWKQCKDSRFTGRFWEKIV